MSEEIVELFIVCHTSNDLFLGIFEWSVWFQFILNGTKYSFEEASMNKKHGKKKRLAGNDRKGGKADLKWLLLLKMSAESM